jgi:hypothetical protein
MKRIIRIGVFETNSSSTHSLTIVDKEEFDAWQRGEVLYHRYEKKFVPAPTATARDEDWVKRYFEYHSRKIVNGILFQDKCYPSIEELINTVKINDKTLTSFARRQSTNDDDDLYSYDRFCDIAYLEYYEHTDITKSGDTIVCFGLYGYDR